ncbi:hypothetical protein CVT26_008985 [Gymnopilus dilepis]|uniref:Uncharacterized protein n=1 Tax=Gymnopilus dilepis TaxID=231916 RepID=A0A409YB48_9AGAR|nr:hypothetical protein CVT26_008985 [Gymnopilus dilepis]
MVKVVLGWVEDFEAEYNRCCDWKASLPPIHMAISQSREADPALGLYDLQSAAGATKFAEFLLSISDQISVVQDCLRARNSVREICWRLDHNHLDKEGQNPHSSEPLSSVRSLTAWLEDVSNSRSPKICNQ